MLSDLQAFYHAQPEPNKSCLLALRDWLLVFDPEISEAWKYRMPCFLYKGKHFCYLWTDKDTGLPYLLVVDGNLVDHPALEQGSRSRMRILRVDPTADLPVATLAEVLGMARSLRQG